MKQTVKIRTLIILVLLALLALFIYQNMAVVTIQFLIWAVSASRALIYLGLFGAGAVVGWLFRRR